MVIHKIKAIPHFHNILTEINSLEMCHRHSEEDDGDDDEAHDGDQHPVQEQVAEVQRDPIPERRVVHSVFLVI